MDLSALRQVLLHLKIKLFGCAQWINGWGNGLEWMVLLK
jgi:hypothetical protein